MLGTLGRYLQAGVTLIELLITLAIIGVLLVLGVQSFSVWLQNSQIRTAGESLLAGLQLARAEAVKQNAPARFQLVTSLGANCAISTTATNWIISSFDPTGACDYDVANSRSKVVCGRRVLTSDPAYDANDICIVQKKAQGEGTRNVQVLADQGAIVFNGLGQLTPTPATANQSITVALTNPALGGQQGKCVQDGGEMRCLSVQISASGQIRMCDPAVTTAGDPRKC